MVCETFHNKEMYLLLTGSQLEQRRLKLYWLPFKTKQSLALNNVKPVFNKLSMSNMFPSNEEVIQTDSCYDKQL